jgi:hypothetical protein
VRLHRLPPEIVSIEPEYRDYEYVTTEEEIVIVDPRSHRIVSTLPKDPARARAQLQGGPHTADMRGGAATASVAVQTPDQRSTPPIPLDAQAGQIVVATQGQGDCTVTIEPQGVR